jgi:hypothetical protein
MVLDDTLADRPTNWLNAVEAGNDITLYYAEPTNQQWTDLCLRQADRILFIASATSAFETPPWLATQIRPMRPPLISCCCTTAGGAGCTLLYPGARSCRSILFVTFAQET